MGSCRSFCPHPGGDNLTRRAIGCAYWHKDALVADLGCGSGRSLEILKERGIKAIGLEQREELCDGEKVLRVTDNVLPLNDGELDGILCECVLSCIEDKAGILAEMARVTKKEGTIAISDLFARGLEGRILSEGSYEKLFTDAGFNILYTEDATPALNEQFVQLIWQGGEEAVEKAIGFSRAERKSLRLGYRLWILAPNLEEEMKALVKDKPVITENDLREHPEDFLKTSQNDIARFMTLNTSGSTGPAKRLYFTAEDLDATADFWTYGMAPMIDAGDKVVVYMRGPEDYTIGTLMRDADDKLDASTLISGYIFDYEKAAKDAEGAACFIIMPGQAAALVAKYPHLKIKSMSLSGDYVPKAVRKKIEESWGTETFTHWGMTETGYGGSVECHAHNGSHIRKDLLIEIVDPKTGEPLPDGEYGEVVMSAPFRKGMPLYRYKTGDIAKIIPGRCSCGCTLPRLSLVEGRSCDEYALQDGSLISVHKIDEILYSFKTLADSRCTLNIAENRLEVIYDAPGLDPLEIEAALKKSWPCLSVNATAQTLPANPAKRKLNVV